MQSCTPPPFTDWREKEESRGGGGGGGVTVAARHDIDGGLLAELIDYTMSQLKSAWFAIIMQDGIQ